MATLDKSITALAIEPLGDQVRAHYRAALAQSIAAGHRQPLVFPWGILAAFIVPTLWLTVPHTSGWLRRANWVVVAFVVVFNLRLVWSTGSPNFACGYGTGLMAAWGIISTLTLLVWTSPQEGAARIVRRKRSSRKKSDDATVANGAGENSDASQSEDLRGTRENGVRRRNAPETSPTRPGPGTPEHEPEYDYIWQPFPANSSWSSRLNWAFDLTTNFRFTGTSRDWH